MDTSAFDKKITNLNTQVEDKKNEMTKIYDKFVDATIRYYKEWSKNKIEKYVESNHEVTLSHNEGRLKELKTGCRDLIKEMPSIVEKNLNKNKYWIHMQASYVLNEFYSDNNRYAERFKKIIKTPLSIIMGHVGILLAKSDYIRLNYQGYDWSSYNDGTIRYTPKFDLNEEMKELIENYSEKIKELKQILDKIEEVENGKAMYQAISRWKQIKVD